MTTTTAGTGTAQMPGGICRYPGCVNQARVKDPAAPGPRPGYCEQEIPEDRGDGTAVLVRHTAMTAFRRRAQLAGQPEQDRPVTALDAQTRAREHAEELARDASQALHGEREAAAAQIARAEAAVTAARAERDDALAAAEAARRDAARAREHDQQRHAAGLAATTAKLAAANDTITTLREQLTRAETALDRERAEQHKTVSLLHDLITSRPAAPAISGEQSPQPAADPADTAGRNGNSRRQAPPR